MVAKPQDERPTAEEIKLDTAKIRAGWSDYERAKRAGVDLRPWTAPAFVIGSAGVAEVVEDLA